MNSNKKKHDRKEEDNNSVLWIQTYSEVRRELGNKWIEK